MKSTYRTGGFDKKNHNIIRWLPLNSFVIFTFFVVARDLAFVSTQLYARPK